MDVLLERMASAQHHESTQVKHDEATGKKITTKIKGFSGPAMAALMKVRNQTAKQASEGVRDIEEEAAKEEGTVDRITWEMPEKRGPKQAIQAIDDIAKLKKEKEIAERDWERLDEAA
jgi:hypothetical protein